MARLSQHSVCFSVFYYLFFKFKFNVTGGPSFVPVRSKFYPSETKDFIIKLV